MKRLLFLLILVSGYASSTPFDLLLQQRNIADTATLPRQVASPGIGFTGVLLTNMSSGLPVLYKVGNSFMIDDNTKTIQSASDWSNVTNKPVFSLVATSGDYNDLVNKPSGSQVNSDWNATSGVASILNKPALAPVATSGAYSDLSGLPSLFNGAYSSLAGIPATFAPSAHTHPISQVTGLQTALDGKYAIPTGNTAQYLRGDGSIATFPTPSSGTVTSITAGAGLSGGTITGSGTISMPNVGNPGTYSGVSTDSQGRVTGGSTRVQSAATRALNTVFQVSATRDALVNYSVQCTVTASIGGGQDGDVFLDIASDSGFTANVQSLDVSPCSQTYTLAIAIQGVQKGPANVRGYIPAGYYARIRTVSNTGTPAFAYRLGQEVLQ